MSAAASVATGSWILDLDVGDDKTIDERCVGVTKAMDTDRMLHLVITRSLRHVVQKDGFAADAEASSADLIITRPDLLRDLPVSTILAPHEVTMDRERALTLADLTFNSSRQKREIMAQVAAAVAARSPSAALGEDVLAVTDELFTNAIYNAPFVDQKTGVNPGVSRTDATEVKYEDGRSGRLIVAADDQRLLLGCVDPFGSLNLARYLHRIKETYVRGAAATMNYGPGGAGLGSYIIFKTGTSLYFGVWPGRATVLFCVMPLKLNLRKRDALPKHLHWVMG